MTGGEKTDTFPSMDSSRGGQIFDWEDRLDTIGFSRMEATQTIDDLKLTELTETSARIDFTNNSGKDSGVLTIGMDAFTLGINNLLF